VARDADQPPLRLYWPQRDPAREVTWVESADQADFTVVPAEAPPESSTLTDREAEVLSYLADGWSNDEIADRLGIGARTVRFHLDNVYRKLGVGRRTEAVREAVSRGYLRF
jgi:DNA-binding NarL/FixJ family response regulator